MRYQFLRFPGGRFKAVTLSYDDGCVEDLRFSDVITKHGFKCTFNLNSKKLRGDVITDEQIKEYFLDRGHEIAVHGAMHRAEGTLRPIEGIREVLDCRLELEERFGMIIRGMAYPDTGIVYMASGANYQTIKNYLTELDIAYARTLMGDNDGFLLPEDFHAWMPTAHHINPKLFDMIESFLAMDYNNYPISMMHPRVFYLWGHSYEFETNNNWNLLDDICEKLAGRDDVWYATNIEIYDYVKAYESLVYSADGKMIYNPTLMDVWFAHDGVVHKVSSGETIKLD